MATPASAIITRPAPQIKYPLATIAYYGPDDKTVTEIAVGILASEDADLVMGRWRGPDVAKSPNCPFWRGKQGIQVR